MSEKHSLPVSRDARWAIGITALLVALLITLLTTTVSHSAKHESTPSTGHASESERQKFVRSIERRLGFTRTYATTWDIDRAERSLADLAEEVEHSPFSDVDTYYPLMKKIEETRQYVMQQSQAYDAHVRAGHVLFECEMVPMKERDQILAERKTEEERLAEEERKHAAEARRMERQQDRFYDPSRTYPYWANATSHHMTRSAAIQALATQFGKSTIWVETNMGASNSLTQIHQNLAEALLRPYWPSSP